MTRVDPFQDTTTFFLFVHYYKYKLLAATRNYSIRRTNDKSLICPNYVKLVKFTHMFSSVYNKLKEKKMGEFRLQKQNVVAMAFWMSKAQSNIVLCGLSYTKYYTMHNLAPLCYGWYFTHIIFWKRCVSRRTIAVDLLTQLLFWRFSLDGCQPELIVIGVIIAYVKQKKRFSEHKSLLKSNTSITSVNE